MVVERKVEPVKVNSLGELIELPVGSLVIANGREVCYTGQSKIFKGGVSFSRPERGNILTDYKSPERLSFNNGEVTFTQNVHSVDDGRGVDYDETLGYLREAGLIE
ncbi:hypothetical protein CMI42_03705 [Candidatus Pacearchaeota archaeon]|nr:hypothetical protein [Candidatus Pacearchaeota archaeon]|tara:strand:- start:140 stop:457 length:318 start_codon:yes stop_codon:yes gene_type:complete